MAKNTNDERLKTAQSVASEAIEALLSVYWGDSFALEQLEDRLTETVLFATRNARPLSEPHPHPELLEGEGEAIAPSRSLTTNHIQAS